MAPLGSMRSRKQCYIPNNPQPPQPEHPLTLAGMPAACRQVVKAP